MTFTSDEIDHIKRTKEHLTTIFGRDSFADYPHHFHHCFLSGGAIGSILRGEVVNDYDIYFYKPPFDDIEEWAALYGDKIITMGEAYRNIGGDDGNLAKDYTIKPCITEHATTFKNKFQYITMHYGTPNEIRKTFDYVHCMPYYDIVGDALYISQEQYDLNMKKILKVNCEKEVKPHRRKKFLDKGWR